jgi:hypothetical protein
MFSYFGRWLCALLVSVGFATSAVAFETYSAEDQLKGDYALMFSAVWCAPCKVLKNNIENHKGGGSLSEPLKSYKVIIVDADIHPGKTKEMGVKGLPTTLFMTGGDVKHQLIGKVPASTWWEKVAKYKQLGSE